jgi:hypothetical protein
MEDVGSLMIHSAGSATTQSTAFEHVMAAKPNRLWQVCHILRFTFLST